MGQPNEKEDPVIILDELNSYEENLKSENINIENKFNSLRNIIEEYQNYKLILDKYPKKKFGLSPMRKKTEARNDLNYDKNKLDEINHKFERVNKWIKMAKTPYYNNLHLIFNKIRGKSPDKKHSKDLSNISSTKNIFSKKDNENIRKRTNLKKIPMLKNDNSDLVVVKKNRKKHNSFDNSSIIGTDYNNNDNKKYNYLEDYTDRVIEERIISFYLNNKSKFNERVFKGPPDSFRWISWCIINELPLERDKNIYNNYLTKDLEKDNKDRIIRDIERTFSDKNINKDELRKKETSLYNILKAFWNLDKEVGYCQGMNLIVGFLLLVSNGNELDIFYLLISNFSSSFKVRKKFNYSFRGLFSEEFPLLYFLNFIFDILLQENLPEVKNHLDEMGITYDLWIGQWFQTLFTIVLPINWLKRVWDCIYSDNIFFIVKFAIAFTRIIKDDIMVKDEEIDIINYFKELQNFSLCPENKFLDEKIDINTLILRAQKIKLDPEEYIKLYKKKSENFEDFNNKMEKNNRISYLLDYGNELITDYKVKHRETVLFESNSEGVQYQDSKDIDNIQDEKVNEQELKENKKENEIKRQNCIFDENKNKLKIKISKSILKNEIIENSNDKKNEKFVNKKTIENNPEEKNNNFKINNLDITAEKRKNYFLNEKNTQQNNPYDSNSPYGHYPMKMPKCDIKECVNTANKNIKVEYNNLINQNYPQSEYQKEHQKYFDINSPNSQRNINNINQNNLYKNYFGNFYQNQNIYSPRNYPKLDKRNNPIDNYNSQNNINNNYNIQNYDLNKRVNNNPNITLNNMINSNYNNNYIYNINNTPKNNLYNNNNNIINNNNEINNDKIMKNLNDNNYNNYKNNYNINNNIYKNNYQNQNNNIYKVMNIPNIAINNNINNYNNNINYNNYNNYNLINHNNTDSNIYYNNGIQNQPNCKLIKILKKPSGVNQVDKVTKLSPKNNN